MQFLAVTDLHYTDLALGEGDRRHALSLDKLREAVHNSAAGCDCIVNLGDTAEGFAHCHPQAKLLDEADDVLRESGLPAYSLIGNHDTHMQKPEFYPHLNMPDRYYAFDCGGYRCLALDACLNDVRQPLPPTEIVWDDCWIDPAQTAWLRAELETAQTPVLVFTHVPLMLDDPQTENPHLVRNRWEIIDLLHQSGKVRAVFAGHYHDGCFCIYKGVPYITFSAMVLGTTNNYAVVQVDDDAVRVRGFGIQQSGTFRKETVTI